MKKLNLNIALIVIVIVSLFYFSCQKTVEDKIDGTWRMINIGNFPADEYREWTLIGGYYYMLKTQPGNPNYDTIAFGNYNIKIKRLSRYLILSETNQGNWDGEWKIDKLNDKYFVVERHEYGLEYYEFVKK
jgi:hypothetical protein